MQRTRETGFAQHALVSLLLLAWLTSTASAHLGHGFGNPFHAISLDEARKMARDEFKLVLVFVTEPGGSAFAYLERPTWEDWRTIDLLIQEAVAVKLDATRHAADLRSYQIDQSPVLLLLNPDGTVLSRWNGDLSAARLMEKLTADLSGQDAIYRARQAVKQTENNDPYMRERLARALTRCQKYDEALTEYLWCLETGLANNVPYARARRSIMLTGFVSLAEEHPPARKALIDQRDAMEQSLRDGGDSANLARDLAELNECLGEAQRNLALYDQLPERSKARFILYDRVLAQLVEHGRYSEALRRIEPMRAFSQEVRLTRIYGGAEERSVRAARHRGTRSFAVARGAMLVEALAGTGNHQEARALAKAVFSYDGTEDTRNLLKEHAERVRDSALAKFIELLPAGDGGKQP